MLRPLRVGKVMLANNLLLAPIAGWCDLAYRLVVRSCGGVGLACTDLLSPEGLLRQKRRSLEMAATCQADSPLCMQLYGCDADRLSEAARWAEDHGAAIVDINMGCPVDKVTKRDGGSALLRDPDGTVRMVEKIARALRTAPLTAKLRLGWDDRSIVAPALAARLEEAGVAMITIHGRTTEMGFSGQARLDGIASVVAAVKRIPVIGNGDIRRPEDAARMIQLTGCAGVMIGRAALSQPWIFRDTAAYLSGDPAPPPLSIEQKCALMRQHFDYMQRFRGERIAAIAMRKRSSWYAKTMQPCRMMKEKMQWIGSRHDFDAVLDEFLEWRKHLDADGVRRDAPAPI